MATWYVSTSGNNGNNGNSTGTAWRTIQYAVTNANVNAGDTIKVLPGMYNENIQITNNNSGRQGNAGSPITLTSNDPNNMAVITGTAARNQMQIYNRSYWTIDHLAFKNYETGGILVVANEANVVGITVQNCLFENQDAKYGVMWHSIVFDGDEPYSTSYSYVLNNTLRNIKTGPPTGYNETITMHHNVNHCLIEGNEVWGTTYIGLNAIANDYVHGTGKPSHIIFRNNRVDTVAIAGSGARTGLYVDGADYVLYENNYITKANGMSVSAECWSAKGKFTEFKHNIVRNNVLDGLGGNSSIMFVLGADHYTVFLKSDANASQKWVDDSAIVHNVFLINNVGGGAFKWGFNRRARVKNNIMANYAAGSLITYIMANLTANGWVSDGNLYWRPGSPAFSWPGAGNPNGLAALQSASGQDYNSIYGQPVFVNSAGGDYRLADASPGSGRAVPLTTASETKSSSATLKVADARYFCDGYGLIGGDMIRVGGQLAQVTNVDYTNNTLTIDRSLSWAAGARVDYDHPGSTPSIGLTKSVSSGTVPPPITVDPPPTTIETPDPGTIVNTDPTFDSGLASWEFYSTGGNYTAAAASGVVTISGSAGGSFTQLMQAGITLAAGVEYMITVRAKSSVAGASMRAQVLNDDYPYTAYNDTEIALGADYAVSSHTFVAPATLTNARIRLEFRNQDASTSFYVDTFQIEVSGETSAPTADATKPADVTVAEGADATLTAVFTATNPTYQWFKSPDTQLSNGAAYSGATTPVLTILDTNPDDNGSYYCVATNSAGSATSRIAAVTITPAAIVDGDDGSDTLYATADTYGSIRNTTWGDTAAELKVGHFAQSAGNNFTVAVAASGSDAHTNDSNYWGIADSAMAVGHFNNTTNLNNYLKFRVTLPHAIPAGATILNASAEIRAFRDTATPAMTITAESSADATAWSSQADFEGRTLTAAGVAWTPTMTGSLAWYETPDLAAIIQEIVDTHGGLDEGAAVAVCIKPTSATWPGSVQGVYVSSYDSSADHAPKLSIEWKTSDAEDYDNQAGFMFTLADAIPDNASIDTATLGIHAKYSTAAPGFTVRAEKTASAAAWTGHTDFEGRTLTTAGVAWAPALTGSYADYTVSVASLIQELVDAYGGLAAGAKIAIRILPATTGWPGSEQGALIHSTEYNSASDEATLALEWSTAAEGDNLELWDSFGFGMRSGLRIGF